MTIKEKIVIKNLVKNFDSKQVLKNVDLTINDGESMVIMGGSGSGKSILIKSIVGLITPTSGSIMINDQEVTNLSSDKYSQLMKRFGFLFQGGALFDSLSIWENVSFALLNNLGKSKKEAYAHAIDKLAQVGLEENVANLLPSELSGGMQKRASLARAISLNPEILFFDEPTTGLDPIMANIINELIVKTSKEIGATTITITHDMHSARVIGDRAAMLYQGEIIWCDTISKIESCENEFVKQFVEGNSQGPIKSML